MGKATLADVKKALKPTPARLKKVSKKAGD
jgi:hypothetical protein